MDDLIKVVVVPPEVLRVVVAIVERGVQAVEESTGGKGDGVAEQTEVQVDRRVDLQLTGIFADEPRLGLRTVVQRVALCLAELSTNAQRVFLVARRRAKRVG